MRLALAQAAASDLLHFGIFPRFLCRDSHSTSNRLRQTIMSDDSLRLTASGHIAFFPLCDSVSLSLFLLDFDAHAWVKNCQVKKRLCASRAVLMICDVSADWMPSAANFVPLPFRNRLESAAVKLYSKGQLGTQAR